MYLGARQELRDSEHGQARAVTNWLERSSSNIPPSSFLCAFSLFMLGSVDVSVESGEEKEGSGVQYTRR
jgi:hypothetical protein